MVHIGLLRVVLDRGKKPGEGRVLSIMAYTGRIRPEGVPFQVSGI